MDMTNNPPPRARHTDPATSHEAADNAAETAPKIDDAIVNFLRARGPHGATSLEITEETGINRISVSPRMKPLETMGFIARTDMRRTSRTSNQASTVWVALQPAAQE